MRKYVYTTSQPRVVAKTRVGEVGCGERKKPNTGRASRQRTASQSSQLTFPQTLGNRNCRPTGCDSAQPGMTSRYCTYTNEGKRIAVQSLALAGKKRKIVMSVRGDSLAYIAR